MKKLIGLMLSGVFALALASCGSDDNGGGAGPVAPNTGITEGAQEIHFEGDGDTISWTSARGDIYIGNGSEDCVRGLNQGADDTSVSQRVRQLEALLNAGVVAPGAQASASNQSRYLTINYSNGESKTFNLDASLASSEELYLSNGDQVVAYYNQVSDDLDEHGQNNCTHGKGDRY